MRHCKCATSPLQTFHSSFHWLCHVDFRAFPFWLYSLIFTTRYHSGLVGPLVIRSQLVLLHFFTFLMFFFSLKFLFIHIHICFPNSFFFFFKPSEKVVSQLYLPWTDRMGSDSFFLYIHNTDLSDFQITECKPLYVEIMCDQDISTTRQDLNLVPFESHIYLAQFLILNTQ